MPNKELLLQYANLKIKEKAIAAELELLKETVQKEVEALIGPDSEQVALSDLPGFSFSLAKARPKWEYSAATKAMQEDLKSIQDEEVQTGKATNQNEGKRELRFNQPKNE